MILETGIQRGGVDNCTRRPYSMRCHVLGAAHCMVARRGARLPVPQRTRAGVEGMVGTAHWAASWHMHDYRRTLDLVIGFA